ncbi:hypothetical protein SAMN03159376_01845 [Pseudomonas sp. NFACC09-4]|uniref:hypothetical protein n=1 Tax=Pseudomonas TaxID=286 RepID=UPI000908D527|nr:hypothetical protein [Pseudomonas sp. NFACC09-4]NHN68236.1 hypothetical protein [Pseudomonas fluorescens]SFW48946.1 hypothetical protein SAMN03159376_01845 [Pseudomonas sp. NFACC09-4]
MQTLSEIATVLFLSLAARHVGPEPTLADAAALIAGRTRKWLGWKNLTVAQQTVIAVGLRLRPATLAQPGRFVSSAEAVIKGRSSLFELVDQDLLGSELKEDARYRVIPSLQVDQIILEHYEALQNARQPGQYAEIPAYGDVRLKHFGRDQIRVFHIPAEQRKSIPEGGMRLRIPDAPGLTEIAWDRTSLSTLAHQLDAATELHSKHVSSLENLWSDAATKTAQAGDFYRINAPTGTGKSVVMIMMAIDAAKRGHKVVIGVPSFVEVDNTMAILRHSIAASHVSLKAALLHSMARVAERAKLRFQEVDAHHPYDYSCILGSYGVGQEPLPDGEEPCFNLQVDNRDNGDGPEKLRHCPYLFRCGRTTMLSQALAADIIVVNHHSLLSGTSRIPLSDTDRYPGSRSLIEILLRYAPVFLIDEIDGLLKSAIDSSVFKLELGNIGTSSPLMRLYSRVADRSRIPGVEPSSLFRVAWALAYCIISVNQLMSLQARDYFEWPVKETTWSEADDGFIIERLGIDQPTLALMYSPEVYNLPEHLRPLSTNLAFWRTNDQDRRPEVVATDLGDLLKRLSDNGKLPAPLDEKSHIQLKASLILRGTLDLIERSLRNLNNELPTFVTANVPYAYEVQRSLNGPDPLSPTPIGPLHRDVYGFKRTNSPDHDSTLNVVAMRGDPHGTLLALPELSALGYAGVKRTFIGFSATAFFPGASAYDLKALDLIDVPDAKGQITFENLNVSTQISGTAIAERPAHVRSLGEEITPWILALLEKLKKDPAMVNRARLLLVTSSDADAETLALTLSGLPGGPGSLVGWVRGRGSQYKPTMLKPGDTLIYDDLAQFAEGKYQDKTVLVSAMQPIARGHNIVNSDGLSAIGGVVVCVRPLPSSDSPENNLAHICYETGNRVLAQQSPGEAMIHERRMSNGLLHRIRTSHPAFSQQPPNIRHYTVMNILVSLTQLVGRGRRGGTPITCYFADAAFLLGKSTWAKLLADSVITLKRDGDWDQFQRHHAGIASAVLNYISQSGEHV